MRIVQLTDFYRPTIGGLERHVETLSRESVKNFGHDVTVITLRNGDLPEREEIDGVRVVRINGWSTKVSRLYADPSRPFHPTFPDPGALASLRRAIADAKPDIVHSHSWLEYSYYPLYDASPAGPGHVITLHDYGLSCVKKTYQNDGRTCAGPKLGKCISCAREQYGPVKSAALTVGLHASRRLYGRADAYVAISRAVADAARAVIPESVRLTVIPSMVPDGMDLLANSAPRPGFLPAQDGYLLFVGALGRHKGVDVLIEAHRRMRHRLPLVMIGAPTGDSLDLSGPDVTVAHNQPSPAVMASWRRASVGVVPSTWDEPLGQVAVEAMLAERPVVASAVGGLKDIVEHGVTGLLIPPKDPGALAQALDSLLDDPQRRARMGVAGRARARAFEVGTLAPRLVELFEAGLRDRTVGGA